MGQFNIFGGILDPGHCEVHPHIHEEYPCFLCLEKPEPRPAQMMVEFGFYPDDPIRSDPYMTGLLEVIGTYLPREPEWSMLITHLRSLVAAKKAETDASL